MKTGIRIQNISKKTTRKISKYNNVDITLMCADDARPKEVKNYFVPTISE